MMPKKTYTHFVDQHGGIHQEAQIDGGNFGDDLLEGVMFIVSIQNGKFVVKGKPEDKDYMKNLNEKKWLKEAEKSAYEHADEDWDFNHLTDNDLFLTPV